MNQFSLRHVSADDATAVKKLADDLARDAADEHEVRGFGPVIKKFGKAATPVWKALADIASTTLAKTIAEMIKPPGT
jgi:hypothetical protein